VVWPAGTTGRGQVTMTTPPGRPSVQQVERTTLYTAAHKKQDFLPKYRSNGLISTDYDTLCKGVWRTTPKKLVLKENHSILETFRTQQLILEIS
jgi:hypothetical protein